ncbi:MAG: hypothetical protein Q7R43_01300 [Candidatus Daviesbacteria bacterium]|nr:hypothetical protein [Candidatus Daviesbacteria bacterium]
MPNHIHMIIMIVGAGYSRPITLGNVIAYFKYQSTKQINTNILGSENPTPTDTWYIKNNPLMWDEDENNIIV